MECANMTYANVDASVSQLYEEVRFLSTFIIHIKSLPLYSKLRAKSSE